MIVCGRMLFPSGAAPVGVSGARPMKTELVRPSIPVPAAPTPPPVVTSRDVMAAVVDPRTRKVSARVQQQLKVLLTKQ